MSKNNSNWEDKLVNAIFKCVPIIASGFIFYYSRIKLIDYKQKLKQNQKNPQPTPAQQAGQQERVERVEKASKPCQVGKPKAAAWPPADQPTEKVELTGMTFYRGSTNIVAGRPGTGKSLYTIGRLDEYARSYPGSAVLYFDTEYNRGRNEQRYVRDGVCQLAPNLHIYNWRWLQSDTEAIEAVQRALGSEASGKADVVIAVDNLSDAKLRLKDSERFSNMIDRLSLEFTESGRCLSTVLLIHPKTRRDVPREFRSEHIDCKPCYARAAAQVIRLLPDRHDEKLLQLKLIKDGNGLDYEARMRITGQPFTDTRIADDGDTGATDGKRSAGRPPDPRRDEMAATAWQLHQQGLTQQQIGQRLGRNQRYVSRLLRRQRFRQNQERRTD